MRKNLIDSRKQQGLTQAQLAKIIHISTRYYQDLEYGNSNGNLKTWQELKLVLNKSIDYLSNQE